MSDLAEQFLQVARTLDPDCAQKPDDAVVVLAEKDAPTGSLVQVIDQVRQGGVQNVSIAASAGAAGG